jgi:hypothetical protein
VQDTKTEEDFLSYCDRQDKIIDGVDPGDSEVYSKTRWTKKLF